MKDDPWSSAESGNRGDGTKGGSEAPNAPEAKEPAEAMRERERQRNEAAKLAEREIPTERVSLAEDHAPESRTIQASGTSKPSDADIRRIKKIAHPTPKNSGA
jgi:hypothetical protein